MPKVTLLPSRQFNPPMKHLRLIVLGERIAGAALSQRLVAHRSTGQTKRLRFFSAYLELPKPKPIPGSMPSADTNLMQSLSRRFAVLQLVCSSLAVVILCLAVDRQVTPRMRASFVAQCELATTDLTESLEPYLAAGEMTSAQLAIDQSSSIPNLKWVYVTAADGKVLAATTLSQSLNPRAPTMPMANDRAWIKLPREQNATLVIRKHVTQGTVWVAFNQAQLLSSINTAQRAIFSEILLVVLAGALVSAVVVRRMMAPVVSLTQAAELFFDSGSHAAPGSSSLKDSDGDLAHWTRAFLAKNSRRRRRCATTPNW